MRPANRLRAAAAATDTEESLRLKIAPYQEVDHAHFSGRRLPKSDWIRLVNNCDSFAADAGVHVCLVDEIDIRRQDYSL